MNYLVCKNPWCKGHFECTQNDIKVIDGKEVYPKECKKCKSFANDLSGGVEWKDKTYENEEGSLYGKSIEISYKITNWK